MNVKISPGARGIIGVRVNHINVFIYQLYKHISQFRLKQFYCRLCTKERFRRWKPSETSKPSELWKPREAWKPSEA